MKTIRNGKHIQVGLCGRSGAGKGTVAMLFAAYGIPSIDTDAVYRKMTESSAVLSPCMQALVERFGKEILQKDNALNRPVLRQLVFGSHGGSALADLNRITHRYIWEETKKEAEAYFQNGTKIVLIDAPLLFESGFFAFCDATILVDAPETLLLHRIIQRDGISEEDAKRRLAIQKLPEELVPQVDYCIINDGNLEKLSAAVEKVYLALSRRLEETT